METLNNPRTDSQTEATNYLDRNVRKINNAKQCISNYYQKKKQDLLRIAVE